MHHLRCRLARFAVTVLAIIVASLVGVNSWTPSVPCVDTPGYVSNGTTTVTYNAFFMDAMAIQTASLCRRVHEGDLRTQMRRYRSMMRWYAGVACSAEGGLPGQIRCLEQFLQLNPPKNRKRRAYLREMLAYSRELLHDVGVCAQTIASLPYLPPPPDVLALICDPDTLLPFRLSYINHPDSPNNPPIPQKGCPASVPSTYDCAASPMTSTPPDYPPLYPLREALTLCGVLANVREYYVDDTSGGPLRIPLYPHPALTFGPPLSSTVLADSPVRREQWVFEALREQPDGVTGKSILLIGGNSGHWESLLLRLGAAHVQLVEYQPVTFTEGDSRVSVVRQLPTVLCGRVDLVLSITSLDHDGLGRYGDPIAPDGDALSMRALRQRLRSCAVPVPVLLSVPVGPDTVVWNLHRVYGPVGLLRFLRGFRVRRVFGWRHDRLFVPGEDGAWWTVPFEPVWELEAIN